MLDEKSLRRPGFREGYAVELADGQKWTLPPVKFRIFPREVDGKIEAMVRPTYADEHAEDLDILYGITPADWVGIWEARYRILCRLLRSNYDIGMDALGGLLEYLPGDEASEARWKKIRSAMLGNDPDAAEDEEGEGADPKGDTSTG